MLFLRNFLKMVLSLIIGLSYIFLDIIYWLKYFTCVTLLRLKKITQQRRFDLYDFDVENQPEKLGILVPKEEIILESPVPAEQLPTSADEVFFYGVNSKSEALVVKLSRNSKVDSDASILLRLSDGRWYHLEQPGGYQTNSDGKCTAYTCGGLKIVCLCPMRRWRVSYTGMLRERKNTNEKEKKTVFVKFTFIWTASSDVYDGGSDLDVKVTADAMAQAKWKSPIPPIQTVNKMVNIYCQSGVLNGTVSIEDESEIEIYLFGERLKYRGEAAFLENSRIKMILGVVPETGLTLHLHKASVPYIFHNFHCGFVVNPSSKIDVLQDAYVICNMSDKTNENLTVMIRAGDQYELRGKFRQERIRFTPEEMEPTCVELIAMDFEVDGFKGSGFMLSADIFELPREFKEMMARKPDKIHSPSIKAKPFTVSLTDEESHFTELAGGKGASLGKLTQLSSQMKSEFTVPKGIVVTTAAYNEFLTCELLEKIEALKDVAYGNIKGKIHEACKIVQTSVECAHLPEKIQREVENSLNLLFGSHVSQLKFAVRSSATGEDSDQMSAAGQMETVLGVQGLKKILAAVKKCWASQFGYIAVEYKRQNGQILNSPMAVVIQEMIECESSGVLFTCDPVTNNPSVVVITSNYGLGESVVSGTEEPDTIVLQKQSNADIKIKNISIGLKHHQIVLSDTDSSIQTSTIVEEVPEDKRNECSISEEMAVNLGNLSLKIESFFRSARDIEWGIKNHAIYILQSRPVTTGETLSDFEIKHEMDGPLRSEGDYFTLCNVGEVMPGAVSILGYDLLNRTFAILFQSSMRKLSTRNFFQQSKYYPTGMLPFYNRMVLDVADVLTMESDDLDSLASKGMMVSLFGRILNDPDLKLKIKQRKYPPKKTRILSLLQYIKNLFFSGYGVEEMKENVFNYQSPALKGRTSRETFNLLMRSCSHPAKPFDKHMDCSMASSSWNIFIFAVLANVKGDIDNDVYSDFAKMVASSTNVESADVPTAMQFLAQAITKDIKSEAFKAMTVEEAQTWLETSPTLAGKKYREYIKRHGHRCIKETDIYSTPWYADPKPLIKLIQNIAGCCEEVKPKKETDFSNILPKLSIALDLKSRLLLKFILPNCHRGIRNREKCKSMLIKSFDNIRKGYQHLSKKMVAEGFLPDAELMFFMTLDEINELLDSRNPKTIVRAKHRRKLHPYLESLSFPAISKGRPVPVNEYPEDPIEYTADLTLTGIPVSQGSVKGYVRVAISLQEAADLKPGEILITKSTDIAWSPYFPILAGVVTELGGLISHGAVVSREYGLPCVVGLHGATRQFVTGDYVLLDGNKGILQRLSSPET